jgi:antitoxin Phd
MDLKEVDKMNINTKTLVSITEANQNFSKVARLVDENGIAVVMKNNVPRYVIIEFSQIEQEEIAAQEDVLTLSNRFINKNREAYKALAK